MLLSRSESKNLLFIAVLSVVVPLLIAILLFMPAKIEFGGHWINFLPHLIGLLNTATAIALVAGFIAIKRNETSLHRIAMTIAFALGCLFIIVYITYHSGADSTVYGDLNKDGILSDSERELIGSSRGIYLFVLLSHISLATIVVPFVLLAFYYAYSGNFIRHKKIVKYTLPIWFYVSVTGVLVYLMIRQYY